MRALNHYTYRDWCIWNRIFALIYILIQETDKQTNTLTYPDKHTNTHSSKLYANIMEDAQILTQTMRGRKNNTNIDGTHRHRETH